ncbi:hypothetical protein PS6_009178, partial [Mucor atramentarius]
IEVILQLENGKPVSNKNALVEASKYLQLREEYKDLGTRYNGLKQHMLSKTNVSSAQLDDIENQTHSFATSFVQSSTVK